MCSTPHGTADGAIIVELGRIFALITGSLSVSVTGFLEKSFRVNVNRDSEKHWKMNDRTKQWIVSDKSTALSAAANHWYENAVRCAAEYSAQLVKSSGAHASQALRQYAPFYFELGKGETISMGDAFKRSSVANLIDAAQQVAVSHNLPPNIFCPKSSSSPVVGLFVELHLNGNPAFKNQLHIASAGVTKEEGICMKQAIELFAAPHLQRLNSTALVLVIEPVDSSWFSFRATTSVHDWTNKGMIIELHHQLPGEHMFIYVAAYAKAVLKCFA